jgi:hypothetical protein
MEKLIFVSSPYSGNVKENVANAKSYCKYVMDQGLIPFAPHLFFTQFLDDSNDTDRLMGLYAGMSMLERCDEFWMFGDTISDGMRLELQEAIRLNKPIGFVQVEWEDAV